MIVKPQTTVGIAAEQQRVQAEIQSRLMVAKSCPRDEQDAIDRIKNACQRLGLADKSEYCYERGGTEITGPTIDLLTVVANYWGNIDYGFRELSQKNGESTVEAFAWDLESNAKRTVVFTVPHKRFSKDKKTRQVIITPLVDPRDIYEAVANYSQRRVRACLEAIIPPDVVDDAVQQCRETLHAKADVTPESIGKLTEAFGKLGVTPEQITKRLGRRLDTMQPAQLVSLRRIYKSIQDGMSKAADWFEAEGEEQPKQTAAEAAKSALRGRAATKATEQPPEPTDAGERPQTSQEPDADLLAFADMEFKAATTPEAVKAVADKLMERASNDAERTAIGGMEAGRLEALSLLHGKRKGTQKELV